MKHAIKYTDGAYNQGHGGHVSNLAEATLYPSITEAEEKATILHGVETVIGLDVALLAEKTISVIDPHILAQVLRGQQ